MSGGAGEAGSQEGACVDTVNHTEAEMPPAQAATVEVKEAAGEKEAGEEVESASTTVCNGVDAHVNGVEEHDNGVDEALDSETGASLMSEDSDEDLANVSVPQLIDKFENISVDQGDSDEERSAEYNLKADESQEIPFTVDSAEASQHEVKDVEIAENANTETVKIEETQPDEAAATETKPIEETLKTEEEATVEEETATQETVSKEEETIVEEAVPKEEETTVKEVVLKEEETTVEEALSKEEEDTVEENVMSKDEETITVESKTIGDTGLDVVQDATSKEEEEPVSNVEEETVEEAVSKEEEETVEEAVSKVEEETVQDATSESEVETAVEEAVTKEEEEAVEEAVSKMEEETVQDASVSTAEGTLAETVEDAGTDVAVSPVEPASDDTDEGQSAIDTETPAEADTNATTQEESVMSKDEEPVESETIGDTGLDVVQEATSESEVVEEASEEDESEREKLIPTHIDVTTGESSNQKETVIDKPGEELDEVEVGEVGEIGNSPKETFLRQDTYTVSSSSVVTSERSTGLMRQDTYVVEQEQEEEIEKEELEQIAEKENPPQEVVEDELQANSEPIMEYSDEPIYREADGEEEEDAEVKIAETEDKYVTAEEVRIQKHSLEKKMSSSTVTSTTIASEEMASKTEQLLTRNIEELSGEKTELVEPSPALPLASLVIAGTLNPREDEEEPKEDVPVQTNEEVEELEEALLTSGDVTSEDLRRRSDVDQLVEDIRDPGLDSSLESIAAMVEESQLAAPEVDQLRVSPEFATAAELIDKNLDKGFDPDDPAVKGIEDWECSNNLDAMDPSLDNLRVKSRKLKNSMFKRMSRSEERKSLLEAAPTREEERKEVDEEQKGCGCFTSWLVYIFIKIFD